MHLAVGTSFAIIIPTSLVSVLTHKKHNSVDFNVLKTYGLFVICGVVLGTLIAAMAQTKSLVLFFSIIVYCLGAYLLNMKDKINKLEITIIKIRALYVLGFWFILQFISSGGGVAYAAHIGGFVSGMILILFFNKKRKNKVIKGPWS